MSLTVLAHSFPDGFHIHESHHHSRLLGVSTSLHCSFLSSEDAQPSIAGGSRRRRDWLCRATTGGSRRDMERLVAKTQHRRARNRKGSKPSKNDLMKELEEEEEAEEETETDVVFASEDSASSPYEIISNSSSGSSESQAVEGEETGIPSQGAYVSESENDRKTSGIDPESGFIQEKPASNKRASQMSPDDRQSTARSVSDIAEDTAAVVVDEGRETQQEISSMVSETLSEGQKNLEDISKSVGRRARKDLSEAEAEAETAVSSIADAAADTVSDTGKKVRETGEELSQDIAEVASIGESLLEDGSKTIRRQGEQARKDISEAGATMNEIAEIAMDTASDTADKLRETGEQVGQDLAEIGSVGRSLLEDSSKAVSERGERIRTQAREVMDEEGEILEQGVARIRSEAGKSFERAQDSVSRAVQETGRAAESVGREAMVVGELLMDTAKDTLRASSSVLRNDARTAETQRAKGNGSVKPEKRPQETRDEERSRYAGYNVLVAGASGRTGRCIVETLVSKGAIVRALVRDAYQARSIQQLKDCEVVEADLYKYETLTKAIGDCNVVICAVGARSILLDPFNTYQVEYEGVLNLISAAKNQGKAKKFILISTIGVTFFQLIPLLFWKKQAELHLQRSGLDYTIVRPGGLRWAGGESEQVSMGGPDSRFFGSITRQKVAEVCVAAISAPGASEKIVEVVGVPGIQRRSIEDLFKVI